MTMMIDIIIVFAAMLTFCIYFAPTLIASERGHNNFMPIFIFNFLAGWSVVVWIICLGWACSDNIKRHN
jgi:hypothetical protein